MQSAVPEGEGGMVAVLGSDIRDIEKVLNDNQNNFTAEISNDNSDGQLVISGKNKDLNDLMEILKSKGIKNIKLPVSAPFHCKLMKQATEIMKNEIEKLNFTLSEKRIVSNVTGKSINKVKEIKNLLIKQIESRVKWRDSIKHMTQNGIKDFIEIGPGKVLSGLVKRIDRDVKVSTINNEEDINNFKNTYEF